MTDRETTFLSRAKRIENLAPQPSENQASTPTPFAGGCDEDDSVIDQTSGDLDQALQIATDPAIEAISDGASDDSNGQSGAPGVD